ncbi:MAG TPA: gliding motility-associated C-terminal domain-containing protein, partial [Segetibacter sp.]
FNFPEVCVNDPAPVFTDSSYIAGNAAATLSYYWRFGDANATTTNPDTSVVRNPSHKYVAAGSYNITLTAKETVGGCSATVTKNFIVGGGSPIADFNFIKSTGICGNDKVEIKENSTVTPGRITKIEILWDSDNNPSSINTYNNPVTNTIYSHVYGGTGVNTTYNVKLRAYSGTNCVGEKIASITVNASPKVVFSPVTPFCLSDNPRSITEAKEIGGVPGGSASFFGNGITTAGIFNPSAAGAGTHTIRYLYTGNGCSDSATQLITVIADPKVTLPAKLYVLQGGSLVLNPTVTGSPTAYLWSPATYLNSATVLSPVSAPKANVTYRLTASIGSCKGYADVGVFVLENPNIPSAFSPNGDGINDTWIIQSLSSYPNSIVEVYDRYGRIIFKSTGYSKPWDGRFNGSIVPLGVYYYIINPGSGKPSYSGSVTILK